MDVTIGHGGVMLGQREVLKPLGLSLQGGQVTGIVGPNGAGKSTLLKLMAGLLSAPGAQSLVDGQKVEDMPARRRAQSIGWLSQARELSWDLIVEDVVALGRHAWGGGRYARLGEADRIIVDNAMRQAGAGELASRHVLSLSGGEQARVHLARLLAAEARCLLLDEPLAALDVAQQLAVMDALGAEASYGRTVCIALHDLQLALQFCDRLIVLDDGALVADGPPGNALSDAVLLKVFGVSLTEDGRFRRAVDQQQARTGKAD